MKKTKILFGVSGIGNGHSHRQIPIIEHFSKKGEVLIFAYDKSYEILKSYFKNNKAVSFIRVAVPFFVGNKNGLDFKATLKALANQNKDFLKINCTALDQASKKFGRPDLVITDYEPTSAQYAYAWNAPLVTIDQQSKYLCGDFPRTLKGFSYQDEVVRLHMFFPRANAQIACSFFQVPKKKDGDVVYIFPPILKDTITKMHRRPTNQTSILVYISAARDFVQTIKNIAYICTSQKNSNFYIFLPQLDSKLTKKFSSSTVSFYQHGDQKFNEILKTCNGIVSTAGHMLLSEAMYLGIPVYAIPVSPYEQHMNALIINKNKFGISHPHLSKPKLAYFIKNIPKFTNNIKNDKKTLLHGVGQKKIIKFLEEKFLQ